MRHVILQRSLTDEFVQLLCQGKIQSRSVLALLESCCNKRLFLHATLYELMQKVMQQHSVYAMHSLGLNQFA